jgi:hypothetical protein
MSGPIHNKINSFKNTNNFYRSNPEGRPHGGVIRFSHTITMESSKTKNTFEHFYLGFPFEDKINRQNTLLML